MAEFEIKEIAPMDLYCRLAAAPGGVLGRVAR